MTDSKTPSDVGTGEAISTPVVDTPTATPPKKPSKGGCGCMLPMLVLLVLVGFAPQIIMMTSLRNQIPAMLMAELPPGVVIGSASVGWTSALQLNDIVIPDDQGRPSLTLKHVTLSRSLWELAQSKDDLGKIAVEKPVLNIYMDNGVTNYDKFLARLAAKKGGVKRSLIDLQLIEGQIAIREESRAIAAAAKPAVIPASVGEDMPPLLMPESGPAAPPALDEPALAEESPVVEAPAERARAEKVIALIDLKSATFKSQLAGEDELVGELTAVLREPAVEQPVTGELRWNLPDGAETGIGSGKLKLDVPSLPLAVLSPWLASFTSGRDLSGEISLSTNAEVVPSEKGLLLAAQVKVPHLDLRLSPADAQSPPFRWVGDDLQLVAEGQGDLAGQLLTIESVQLRTPIVNADLAGTVKDLPGQAICGLVGRCDLNLADLLAGLPAEWADKIQVEGLQLGEIRVEGALRRGSETAKAPLDVVEVEAALSMPLRINADLQWAAANVMGFKSEHALVNVDWSEKQLSIHPNRLPVGSGQWVASPRIEFTPTGNYLVFDGGPVFENVDFTQEMSETWLRYVSPLLGSATSIEGSFSLSASPLRVALAPPHEGDFKGVIAIHTAQVGPGPLVKQILTSISALQTMLGRNAGANANWMQVNQQQVPFAFVDGRVYHKDLTVGLGDVVVQSEGSVGLDETIDFRITVPIPDKWTSGKPLLANLQGEVIPLEMQGTLDQPQLDGRALANFGKQIGFKSAGGLLQQLIEKRLDQEPDGEVPATPRPRRQR